MKRFRAKITGLGPGGAWSRVTIPFDAEKMFGAKGRVSVKIALGTETFHTSIFPNGDGTHHLMFNKAMQKAAGAGAGDTVSIGIEADKGEEAQVPAPLGAALKKAPGATAKFQALTPAGRREFINWIVAAKQDATRIARAAKTVEMVLAGKKRLSS